MREKSAERIRSILIAVLIRNRLGERRSVPGEDRSPDDLLRVFILSPVVLTGQQTFAFRYLEINHITDTGDKKKQKQVEYDEVRPTS